MPLHCCAPKLIATSSAMILCLCASAPPWANKFVEQMFTAGNFSFLPKLHHDRAPTCNDPDPNDLPHNDPHHTGDNSCEVDSAQQSAAPSMLSPNTSPVLSLFLSSSETSDSTSQINASHSCTRPSFFSSTGIQTSNNDSDHVLSKSSS